MSDLLSISPMLVTAFTGLLVMALDLLAGRGRKGFLAWVTAGGFAVAGVLACLLWRTPVTLAQPFLANVFALDAHGWFFAEIVLLSGGLAALLAADHLPEQGIHGGETYGLLSFSVTGAILLIVATDLVTLFLGLEIMSLALYVMAASKASSAYSAEAGIKYFLLGGVASAFLLLTVAFLYGATGHLGLVDIARDLVTKGSGPDPLLVQGAMVLLVVALGFKVAAVPFHFWTPDVYEGAPTPVTAFMAGAVKAAAFAVLARVVLTLSRAPLFVGVDVTPGDLLLGLSVASMVVGNVLGIVQTNVKRILAYSSIAHAGYLLLGVWATQSLAGTAARTLNDAVPFYLLTHAVATVGAFGVLALLGRAGEEDMSLDRIAGLGRRHPGLGLALLVSILSLAGLPPLGGFLAKFNLFRQILIENPSVGLPWVILALLMSVVALYYYLRILVYVFFKEPDGEPAEAIHSTSGGIALGIAAALTLVLGVAPGAFLEASHTAAQATVLAAPTAPAVPPASVPAVAATPRDATPIAGGAQAASPSLVRPRGEGDAIRMLRDTRRLPPGIDVQRLPAPPLH